MNKTSLTESIARACQSKRVLGAIATIGFVVVNQNRAEPIVTEETMNQIVGLVFAMILGDSWRPTDPQKGDPKP